MRCEKGNALFLILIAVALFAALSYAVTQSGRSGGDANKEESLITAGKVTQYGAVMRTAVDRMILSGTIIDNIYFTDAFNAPCASGENCVFSSDGGGMYTESNWVFWSKYDGSILALRVKDLGTTEMDVMMTTDATKAQCEAIDRQLGLPYNPVVADTIVYSVDAEFEAYPMEPFACLELLTGAGIYWYYHVLKEL